jgi:hypothetical protein
VQALSPRACRSDAPLLSSGCHPLVFRSDTGSYDIEVREFRRAVVDWTPCVVALQVAKSLSPGPAGISLFGRQCTPYCDSSRRQCNGRSDLLGHPVYCPPQAASQMLTSFDTLCPPPTHEQTGATFLPPACRPTVSMRVVTTDNIKATGVLAHCISMEPLCITLLAEALKPAPQRDVRAASILGPVNAIHRRHPSCHLDSIGWAQRSPGPNAIKTARGLWSTGHTEAWHA